MELNPVAERRRHQRYSVRDGALAFLGPIPCKIEDISNEGMGVKYVVFEKKPEHDLKIDLFFPEKDFYLPDIPAFLVSDVQHLVSAPFSTVEMRRVGLKFGSLTEDQKAALEDYICQNSVAEV